MFKYFEKNRTRMRIEYAVSIMCMIFAMGVNFVYPQEHPYFFFGLLLVALVSTIIGLIKDSK